MLPGIRSAWESIWSRQFCNTCHQPTDIPVHSICLFVAFLDSLSLIIMSNTEKRHRHPEAFRTHRDQEAEDTSLVFWLVWVANAVRQTQVSTCLHIVLTVQCKPPCKEPAATCGDCSFTHVFNFRKISTTLLHQKTATCSQLRHLKIFSLGCWYQTFSCTSLVSSMRYLFALGNQSIV